VQTVDDASKCFQDIANVCSTVVDSRQDGQCQLYSVTSPSAELRTAANAIFNTKDNIFRRDKY